MINILIEEENKGEKEEGEREHTCTLVRLLYTGKLLRCNIFVNYIKIEFSRFKFLQIKFNLLFDHAHSIGYHVYTCKTHVHNYFLC